MRFGLKLWCVLAGTKKKTLILSVCLRGNSKYHYYGIRLKPDSPLNRLQEDMQYMAMRQQPVHQKQRWNKHPLSILVCTQSLSHIPVTSSLPSGSVCEAHSIVQIPLELCFLFFLRLCNWFPLWPNRWTLTPQFSLHSDQGKYSSLKTKIIKHY